jgi:hypothetical protein
MLTDQYQETSSIWFTQTVYKYNYSLKTSSSEHTMVNLLTTYFVC